MDLILPKRVVPVSVLESADEALRVAEALLAGGLPILEVTLRTPAALDALSAVKKRFPEMLVGAGTILSVDQLEEACDSGAQFGVSPGLNEAVVARANEIELPFVPGIMTPSEIERGLALGCSTQKFFPAEPAGGVRMLKALAGPYTSTGVRFIPLGGVNPSNAKAYLDLPIVAAIGGSWLVERTLVASANWIEISSRAKDALALVSC
jgi:2-dehydro-3-deoxyphosphogluconate aldolase/(4S)-4-hydroxy-2-oxoglutarate aldolase